MEPQGESPVTPMRAAPEPSLHAQSQRSRRVRTAALVLVSLAVGATGMWLAIGRAAVAPAPSHQTEQTSQLGAPDPNAPLADASASKRVYISPARQQLIGVRTAEVTHQALETSIRTVGVIAYDETRVAEIHAKIAGWAETVSVDFVGKQVQKGQPLFTIYSPDLVATQREYLLALKADRQLSSSPIEETREGARS